MHFLKLVGRSPWTPFEVLSSLRLEWGCSQASPNPRGIAVASTTSLQWLSEVCVTPVIWPVVVFTWFLFFSSRLAPFLLSLSILSMKGRETIKVQGKERERGTFRETDDWVVGWLDDFTGHETEVRRSNCNLKYFLRMIVYDRVHTFMARVSPLRSCPPYPGLQPCSTS